MRSCIVFARPVRSIYHAPRTTLHCPRRGNRAGRLVYRVCSAHHGDRVARGFARAFSSFGEFSDIYRLSLRQTSRCMGVERGPRLPATPTHRPRRRRRRITRRTRSATRRRGRRRQRRGRSRRRVSKPGVRVTNETRVTTCEEGIRLIISHACSPCDGQGT